MPYNHNPAIIVNEVDNGNDFHLAIGTVAAVTISIITTLYFDFDDVQRHIM